MPAILALAVVVILALIVVGFLVHLLFSPWLLAAVAIIALIKFWPRGARQR